MAHLATSWTHSLELLQRGGSNGVQVVVKQVSVDVERHRRRGVAKHPLHGLHVGPRRHGERRGGVAQVVGRDAREALVSFTQSPNRRVEVPAAEVPTAKHRSPSRGEDEIRVALASASCSQRFDKEAGEWHRPALMTFRRSPDELTANLRHRLAHFNALPSEVEGSNAEGCKLATSKPGMREYEHQVFVAFALLRKQMRLFV